jgi:hypothetical protein
MSSKCESWFIRDKQTVGVRQQEPLTHVIGIIGQSSTPSIELLYSQEHATNHHLLNLAPSEASPISAHSTRPSIWLNRACREGQDERADTSKSGRSVP